MKSCSSYNEILWKDIYGELTPDDKASLEQHLEICSNCFKEHKKMCRFINNIQKAVPCARLESHDAELMFFSIKQELRKNKKISWLPKWFTNSPNISVPALVTTCLLLLMFAWTGIQSWKKNLPVQTVSINSEDQMIIKNFNIINNLDLLEEIEAVEKLVQVVDQPEYGSLLNKLNIYVKKEINLNEQFT